MSEITNNQLHWRWDTDRDGCKAGQISIDRVVDIDYLSFDHQRILPDADTDELRRLAGIFGEPHIVSENLALSLSFHSYLVRTAKYTILVDTCCGNDKERPSRIEWHQRNGPYLDNLLARGVSPEDVDFVMCTHLHADHVGWNTKLVDGRWAPTFPNAQYLFVEKEYSFWKQQQAETDDLIMHGSHADSVLPVIDSGQAKLVAPEHEIVAGVYMEPAYGHTPGTVVLHLETAGAHAVICGDVMHHPVQLAHPEWSSSFCEDPGQSAKTRTELLGREGRHPSSCRSRGMEYQAGRRQVGAYLPERAISVRRKGIQLLETAAG